MCKIQIYVCRVRINWAWRLLYGRPSRKWPGGRAVATTFSSVNPDPRLHVAPHTLRLEPPEGQANLDGEHSPRESHAKRRPRTAKQASSSTSTRSRYGGKRGDNSSRDAKPQRGSTTSSHTSPSWGRVARTRPSAPLVGPDHGVHHGPQPRRDLLLQA